MAGKRQLDTIDHMMYNKLSRIEETPQLSSTYPGRITPKDLQTSKNFLKYAGPGTKEQISAGAWKTTASYQHYADGSFNQHLQTSGVSDKCQRLDNEGLHNPLQQLDTANNHFSVHQNHPVHNYLMSSPRACPPIVMPRPVYRSPSSFMDVAYGTMGVGVGSRSLCTPAVDWSTSTGFPFTSSPSYANQQFSAHNNYPEITGILSSLPRGLQEPSPVHRHRVNTSLAVEVSPTRSQQDTFKNHCQAFASPNAQLRHAEGTAPVERQRSSAFNVPTHHQQTSTCQGNLDSRIANLYSKIPYNNTINSIPQRSFNCMDMAPSSHSVSGGAVYSSSIQRMHSDFVNTEATVRHSYSGGNLEKNIWTEKDSHGGHASTSTELQCSAQKDKDFWIVSGQINRDRCVGSSRVDRERLVDTSLENNCSQDRTIYRDHFTEHSAHPAFQQNRSSNLISNVSVSDMMAYQSAREYTIRPKMATVHNPIRPFVDNEIVNTKLIEHSSQTQIKKSNPEHAKSTILVPTDFSGVGSHFQKGDDSMKVKQPTTLLDPNCALPVNIAADCLESSLIPVNKDVDVNSSRYSSEPVNNSVGVCNSKSSTLAMNKDVDIDCPKSPPMPVINDVFSLAPYCAYLEGRTNSFAVDQGLEVKNQISTSPFSQHLFSPKRTKNIEKEFITPEKITELINDKCLQTVKNQEPKTLQKGEPHGVSMVPDKTDSEIVVLDLSLKKSRQKKSSSCDQETLSSLVTEKCLTKPTEKNLKQTCHDICRSQVSDRISHTGQENCPPECANQENPPFECTSSISGPDKEICLSTKPVFYRSQESHLSRVTEVQPLNNVPSLAINYLPQQIQKNYPFQVTDKMSCQLPENYQSKATNSLAKRLEENYPPQGTESLSRNFQGNCSPQATHSMSFHQVTENQIRQLHENYPSERKENMLHVAQSSCTSQVSAAKPVYTSLSCSSQSSNFSLYVNTIQTPITFLPQRVLLPSPSPVYSPKNPILHTSQRHKSAESSSRRAKIPLSTSHSITSPPGSENEANGFHSSKSFMFRKYKLMKFSSSGGEMQADKRVSSSRSSPFLLPSNGVQSLPPSAPESSPTLGEANVSLASVDDLTVNGSGQQFSELHRSVRSAIKSSVVRSPSSLLEDWVAKSKEEESSRTPIKNKNGSRSYDHSSDSPCHDIWLAFDGVRLLLHKLISQLETFMFTRSCPFPHVIRAGAIFIPIYLVKEVLFPELLGPSVDRILQKHKVELRPTTLSEEKLLRETELKGCPSRMLKLLALKQLPDVYPDLINLFCGHTVQKQLDDGSKNVLQKVECQKPDSSIKDMQTTPSKKDKASLILKLKRICKHPGSQVYMSQRLRTPEKGAANKLQKRTNYCKKNYRTRTMFTYKKRRRGRRKCNTGKGFPDLVGKRILHLFDDGKQDVWFPGRVLRVHKPSRKNPRDTQYEVWYDAEPGTRYFLELLQDYEKGWLKLDS